MEKKMKRLFATPLQRKSYVLAAAAACLCWAAWPPASSAYITGHPDSLDQVVNHSQYIFVVRVDRVSLDKGVIIYRKVSRPQGSVSQRRSEARFRQS